MFTINVCLIEIINLNFVYVKKVWLYNFIVPSSMSTAAVPKCVYPEMTKFYYKFCHMNDSIIIFRIFHQHFVA